MRHAAPRREKNSRAQPSACPRSCSRWEEDCHHGPIRSQERPPVAGRAWCWPSPSTGRWVLPGDGPSQADLRELHNTRRCVPCLFFTTKADGCRMGEACLVRAVLMSGKVTELYRTKVISNSLQPMWNEAFQAAFVEADQPLLLLFDVWDEDDPNKPMEAGGAQHLGSAAVPLLSGLEPAPRRRRLWLQADRRRSGVGPLKEPELMSWQTEVARNAENGPKGGSKLSRQRSGHALTSAKTFNVNKGTTPKTFFERLKDAVVEFKNQMTESADAGKRSVLSVELRTCP
eukprot:g13683.t1